MQPFTWDKPTDEARALAGGGGANAQYIAGGTTLVDLMRIGVMAPAAVVDITGLPYAQVEDAPGGGLKVGALVPNSDLAEHAGVATRFPVLREALLSGASPQLRNLATTGGNLLQRPRCPYFRDPAVTACNKRKPGSGCAAMEGYNRSHAVLGGSAQCIATHPSDMAVAMLALDAIVHVIGPGGARTLPVATLHTLPGEHPEIESTLARGDLITHVELPATPFAAKSHYVKARDRASYAFALASAGVAVELTGRAFGQTRVVLGGVGTKPWRSLEAEAALAGQPISTATFAKAAEAALTGAVGKQFNTFKIELAKRTLVRALEEVTGGAK